MRQATNYINVRLGMLTGIRRIGSVIGGDGTSRANWEWRCDCGVMVQRPGPYVAMSARRGHVPNCGCRTVASKAANGKRTRTHGLSVGPARRLYDVHRQMMRRCHDPACKDYQLYGARGITVCEGWRTVAGFIAWAAASGYRQGLTIERRDNNAGYQPDNCTWIPNEHQARNTRRLRRITAGGRTLYASEWARETGISIRTIIGRLNRGWPGDRAVQP